jgi:hypothetical protein
MDSSAVNNVKQSLNDGLELSEPIRMILSQITGGDTKRMTIAAMWAAAAPMAVAWMAENKDRDEFVKDAISLFETILEITWDAKDMVAAFKKDAIGETVGEA